MKMVEGAIVMPIIILISMAVIYFSIFQFENFNLQIRLHQELLKAEESMSMEKYNCISLGGIMDDILETRIYGSIYVK
ncbi:MAG: hypothetical protein MJ146_01085 [Clostridia bacterium]|nr:hypothetical protein [Clostridia bacterium]